MLESSINHATSNDQPSNAKLASNPFPSAFDPAQEEKLKLALAQIAQNDPLDYRRKAVEQPKLQAHSPLISQNDLIQLGQLQAVLQEPIFTSHRPILGPFIVAAKRLIFRFVKKWLSIALARQFEINQRVFNLAVTVRILEHRIRVLEAQQRDRS